MTLGSWHGEETCLECGENPPTGRGPRRIKGRQRKPACGGPCKLDSSRASVSAAAATFVLDLRLLLPQPSSRNHTGTLQGNPRPPSPTGAAPLVPRILRLPALWVEQLLFLCSSVPSWGQLASELVTQLNKPPSVITQQSVQSVPRGDLTSTSFYTPLPQNSKEKSVP